MVFKKPYALLIKYFKLIHLIITLLMSYTIYKMTKVVKFFNEYISSGWKSITENELSTYINIFMYIAIVAIILLSIIIYLLMRYKKKPRLYYLLTPILYIIIFIVLNITSSTLETAILDVISPIKSRAIRDILLIFTGIQFIFIIISLIRAIGFDVKKFNFRQDLIDLKITESDNEEVEVGFEIEKYKISRKINRRLRNIKYIFLEHKFIWISILTLIATILISILLIDKLIINKTYSQNKFVQLDKYSINIKNSYITNVDYKNDEISDKYNYVILDTIINNSIEKNTFNIDNLSIEINKKIYTPSLNIYSKFKDYGTGYKEGTYLKSNYNNYIFVFKIPKDQKIRNAYFRYLYKITYKEGTPTNEYRKIKLKIEDNDSKEIKQNLNNELNFNNNSINIIDYEINNEYLYNYEFCIDKNNCTNSKGVIKTSTGKSTTILKLNTKYNLEDNLDLFNDYLTIKYEKNNKYYIQKHITNITPSNIDNDSIYLEVTNNIKESKYISIDFKYKGINYSYILKNEK